MTTNHIIVHKTDDEGLIIIDRLTGSVLTPADECPEWASGLAAAMLAERTGWYEKRLGKHLPDALRSPQVINMADLTWAAVDLEGDEVEVEASAEHRMTILAGLMDLDLNADNFELPIPGEVASAMTDYTYMTQPTDEQTLAEAEAMDMGETTQDQKAATGTEG